MARCIGTLCFGYQADIQDAIVALRTGAQHENSRPHSETLHERDNTLRIVQDAIVTLRNETFARPPLDIPHGTTLLCVVQDAIVALRTRAQHENSRPLSL